MGYLYETKRAYLRRINSSGRAAEVQNNEDLSPYSSRSVIRMQQNIKSEGFTQITWSR